MDRLFGEGVRPLRLEDAVFAAMLDGWDRQQRSRMLRPATISAGVRLVRRVRASADRWPWEWTAADLEDFISDLASAPLYRRPATLRNYQSQLRGFLDYLVDERYMSTTALYTGVSSDYKQRALAAALDAQLAAIARL